MDIEGTISNQNLSILIDIGATLSYITPKRVEDFHLSKESHAKPWLVQLATEEKRKVTDFVANYEVKIQDHVTRINLNIFPLDSYDTLIGMNWLERHKVILNCFDKTFTYVAEHKTIKKLTSISKPVLLR